MAPGEQIQWAPKKTFPCKIEIQPVKEFNENFRLFWKILLKKVCKILTILRIESKTKKFIYR